MTRQRGTSACTVEPSTKTIRDRGGSRNPVERLAGARGLQSCRPASEIHTHCSYFQEASMMPACSAAQIDENTLIHGGSDGCRLMRIPAQGACLFIPIESGAG